MRSWCVAATVSEHASAGRQPVKVVKTYDATVHVCPIPSAPGRPDRTARAACVSHSLVTTKRCGVKPLRRLLMLSVANVPPECEMSSTHESEKLCDASWNEKPTCGVGKLWPSWPRSLLAESTTILSAGKRRCRSEANCSPSQSETSHPEMRRSTEPSCVPAACACSRLRSRACRVNAVRRLSELEGSSQSSWMRCSTDGISAMSRPTGSRPPIAGIGSTRGLPPSRSTRFSIGRWEPKRCS